MPWGDKGNQEANEDDMRGGGGGGGGGDNEWGKCGAIAHPC